MTTRKVLLAAFMLVLFSVSVGAQITMTPPVFQGIDNSGNPCSACKLYIYQTGTATPVTAYMNVGLTTAHPFPVVLDSNGRASVFVDSAGIYDVRLQSADDVVLWQLDGYQQAQPLTDRLSSTGDVLILLDTDGGQADAAFIVRNSNGMTVFSVTEDGTVSSAIALVADGSVTNAKLAAGAVTDDKVTDVGASKLTGTVALARLPVLGTANVANLDAGDVTTGVFAAARLPAQAETLPSGSADTDLLRGGSTQSWYEMLDSNGRILAPILGEETADATKFLRGDRRWVQPFTVVETQTQSTTSTSTIDVDVAITVAENAYLRLSWVFMGIAAPYTAGGGSFCSQEIRRTSAPDDAPDNFSGPARVIANIDQPSLGAINSIINVHFEEVDGSTMLHGPLAAGEYDFRIRSRCVVGSLLSGTRSLTLEELVNGFSSVAQ